jgi:hypothetical protein
LESEFDLIDLIVSVCEELGLPYAIGGSMASMSYGEFRATADLDVVLSLHANDIPLFLSRFPRPAYYHDERAALEAVRTGGQFNILLTGELLKIDVHIAADPIARAQVERARRLQAPSGRLANYSPPEELIIKKLQYYDLSGSERQLRDVASMLRVSGAAIDRERISTLVGQYGLADAWEAVQRRLRSS